MRGKGKKGPNKVKQVWRKKEPPPPPPPPLPPWVDLPRDITANILQRLGAVEVLERAQKVCTTWRSVCKDPTFWRVIDMRNLGEPYMCVALDIMCRHAVDLGQGQVIDINIEYFGSDDLLQYIAERCSQLRRLRIACCYGLLSGEAFSRFPLLEELHLFFTSVSTESLEKIGHSCPLLKSFSLNSKGYKYPDDNYDEEFDEEYNKDAFTIAKSMPELRHLRLFGQCLTNKGLQAILDGCPHLESLDLRQCYSVELGGDLGKRCSEQIKNLRRPYDSTADYEFDASSYDDESCIISDLDRAAAYDGYDDAEYLYYDDFTGWDHEDYWDNDDSDFEDIFGFY